MIEALASGLKETSKEIDISSNEIKPKFFETMPRPESIGNVDEPVSKKTLESEEHNGTTYFITRNESLEGDVHPITGVPFEKKLVELPDEKIEGVFPIFQSEFDAVIPVELYEESDNRQFNGCNEQLREAVENDSDLRKSFSGQQLEQIYNGDTPDGYVWHHDAIPGKLQLVDFETHSKTGHTGGRTVWGGGNENR